MTRPISPSADALAPGQRIGPFVLLAPLGAGGSGRIWAAARLGQLGFNKRMVLKVMREDRLSSTSARQRFDREACLGGRLRHPNVRAVHDLGSYEGRPYMALSWVDASLVELLQHAPGERLEPAVVCWIGMQCCSALTAAHGWVEQDGRARAIIHRDVSPGNILLSADGHALLADLAAPEDDGSPGAEGRAARFFGNIAYAAPEALRQQALDARADLYSLGCVLFEALTGTPAFEGDDERTVMFQIVERGAPDLATRAPAVPAPLASVVQRCLARPRDERFESALELRAALSACCRERPAFSLERETAAFIHDVLGARIREREEAMHTAFERFAPSALGRTDTLPIVQVTAELPMPGRPSVSDPSVPGTAVSQRSPGRRRWQALAALFGLLLVVGLYASSRRPLEPAGAPDRVTPARPSGTALPSAVESGARVDGSPQGSPEAVGRRDVQAADAGPRLPTTPTPGTPTPAPGAGPVAENTLRRPQSAPVPPAGRAPRARPMGPAGRAPSEPSGSPDDPFSGLEPERNPYEEIAARRDAAKAAAGSAPEHAPPASDAPAAPPSPAQPPQK